MTAATPIASPEDIRRLLCAIRDGETFDWVGRFDLEDDDDLRAERIAARDVLIECLRRHYIRPTHNMTPALTPEGLRLAGPLASPTESQHSKPVVLDTPRAKAKRHASTHRPKVRTSTSLQQAEALTTGLIGLGFGAPKVRAFVAGLGDRVAKEPLPALIVEGLSTLSSTPSSASRSAARTG